MKYFIIFFGCFLLNGCWLGDEAHSIITTSDGHLVVSGETFQEGRGYWVLKLNKDNGNKIWEKTYDGTNNGLITSIVETSDGNLVMAAMTCSKGDWNYIIKISGKDGR